MSLFDDIVGAIAFPFKAAYSQAVGTTVQQQMAQQQVQRDQQATQVAQQQAATASQALPAPFPGTVAYTTAQAAAQKKAIAASQALPAAFPGTVNQYFSPAATIPIGTPAIRAPIPGGLRAGPAANLGEKYVGYEQYVQLRPGGKGYDLMGANRAIAADQAIMANWQKGLISTSVAVENLRSAGLAMSLREESGERGPTETTFPTGGGGTITMRTPVFRSQDVANQFIARYDVVRGQAGPPSVSDLQRYGGMTLGAAQRAVAQLQKSSWYDSFHPTLGIDTYFTRTGGFIVVNAKASGQVGGSSSPWFKVYNYNPATDDVTKEPGISPQDFMRGARVGIKEPGLPTRSAADAAMAARISAITAAAPRGRAAVQVPAESFNDALARVFPSFGAQARETGPTRSVKAGPQTETQTIQTTYTGAPPGYVIDPVTGVLKPEPKEPPAGWIAGIPLLGDVYRAGQRFTAGRSQAEMAERYKSPLGDFLLSRPTEEYLLGVLPKHPGTFVAGLPGAAMETWAAGDVVLSDILTGTGAMPEYEPTGGPMDILGGGYEFVRQHPGTAAELPLLGYVIGPVIGVAEGVSPLLGAAVKWGGLGLLGYSTFEKGKEIVEAPPEEQYMKLGGALAEYGLLLGPSAGKYIYEKAPIRPGIERWKMPSGAKATMLGIQSRRGTPIPEMYPLGYRVVEEIPLGEALLPTKQGIVGRLRGAVGKIGLGTPEMSLRSIMGEDIFLAAQIKGEIPRITVEGIGPGATRILTKAAVRSMEGSAEEVGKWTLGRGIRAITSRAGVSPGAMRPQILDVVTEHKLPNPEKVADAVIRVMKADMAKGEAGYMYGSPIQRAAGATVGEPGLPRVGKDIDYMAIAEKVFKEDMVRAINEAAGQRVATVKGGKILDPAGRTLFDVHEAKIAAEIGVGGVSPTPIEAEYIGLGIRAEPKVLTEEGLRAMSMSEQSSRKLLGATYTVSEAPRTLETPTAKVTGRIMAAYEGRLKDIGDYYFAERTNIKALGLQGRTGSAAKASTKLEKWLDLWGPDNAAYIRDTYAMRVTGGGVEFPTLVTGEEVIAGSMDGMGGVVDILARAPYPAMVEPVLGAARSISPPGLPAPTARLPSPVDDAARAIFYGGEGSMGAARRGTAGILERPSPGVSPVDRAMREAASLSAFSGAAMERPSPTMRRPVPAGPRVETSPAPYQRMDEEIASASMGIFGYPAPSDIGSPPARVGRGRPPGSPAPKTPPPERPYTPSPPPPEPPYTPRTPPPEPPYTPKTPPPERPYTPRTPPPDVTTLTLQEPVEQKKQKKKEEDEQLRWRRRGARRAVHVYSEIAPGATAEEVMAMVFGGAEPQQRRVKVQAKVQAKAPAKPGGRGKQKPITVEEEAQRITDQEMRRIWGG